MEMELLEVQSDGADVLPGRDGVGAGGLWSGQESDSEG